jgi:hypothetical protein
MVSRRTGHAFAQPGLVWQARPIELVQVGCREARHARPADRPLRSVERRQAKPPRNRKRSFRTLLRQLGPARLLEGGRGRHTPESTASRSMTRDCAGYFHQRLSGPDPSDRVRARLAATVRWMMSCETCSAPLGHLAACAKPSEGQPDRPIYPHRAAACLQSKRADRSRLAQKAMCLMWLLKT